MPKPLSDEMEFQYEQSARMLQSRDKWRGGKALHHAWRLSCISAIATGP